ncbi:hypothetical protein ACFSL6_05405 [Paenibacillus thailandensis]|uniref:Uncharacterized protein n=1 Tax=Paenibacillus thailandensis TaxID=393250 RepID=A0ABW5QSD0_9BACL
MFLPAESLIERLPGALTADLPFAAELRMKRIELFVIPAIGVDMPGYRVCMRLTTAYGYGWSETFIEKKEKPSDWVQWSSNLVHCINGGEEWDETAHPLDQRLRQMLHAAAESVGAGFSAAAASETDGGNDSPAFAETASLVEASSAASTDSPAAVRSGKLGESSALNETGSAEARAGYIPSVLQDDPVSGAYRLAGVRPAIPIDAKREQALSRQTEDLALLARSECYISLF